MATSEPAWSELLCADVSRFSLEPVAVARISIVRPDPLASPLRMRISGQSGLLLDEVIVTR
jgi:hypothetical protein